MESISTASFAVDALAKFASVDIPDRVLREVEGVMLLVVSLTQQTTATGAISSILLWAQGRFSKSIFKTLKTFIEELLVSPQSETQPDWLLCMRDMRHNWQLCKGNRAFKQISKLLGCLVMVGLCDVSSLTFTMGKFKVFTPDINEKHTNAFDVADALFETVIFFAEGAYLCFKTGSITPLLLNDRMAMELDTEYAQICAWFKLVENGNLTKFTEMTDHEFEKRMNDLSTQLLQLSGSVTGLDKKLVMDKVNVILNMQNDFISLKMASGIRHAPWAFQLFGASSQGKSTLGDQLLDALLLSQNMPLDKRYRCAFNPADKFWSNWTSDKLVAIFDDMCNDKAAFNQTAPTRTCIDVVNNQTFYANKAEISAKGKCFVEPWLVMATTNKKDLDAGLYSNCPYSIQRRFINMTVEAKREFQRVEDGIACGIDAAKVQSHYTDEDGTYTPPMFDDIWRVTVERAVKPKNLKEVAGYKPVEWNGKKLKNVPFGTVIQWAIKEFDAHRACQTNLLKAGRNREEILKLCPVEGCKQLAGNCPDHPDACIPCEPHFGKETLGSIRRLWQGDGVRWRDQVDQVYERADAVVARKLYDHGSNFLKKVEWVRLIPKECFQYSWVPEVLLWFYEDDIWERYEEAYMHMRICLFLACFSVMCFLPYNCALPLIFIFVYEYSRNISTLRKKVEAKLLEELKEKNMALAPMLRSYRDQYAKYICGTSVGIAAIYGLSKAYRAYRKDECEPQGSLEPKTVQEVDKRDQEVNVWAGVVQRELPITEHSKRMSTEQLSSVVEKALVYGSIHTPEGAAAVNGLMLSSNVIVLPHHYFEKCGDDLECTFRKRNPEATGGKFVARINKDFTHLVPNTDLRICYIPNGGSFKNLVNCFPTAEMPATPFVLKWRNKQGEIIVGKGLTRPGVVSNGTTFNGGAYKNLTMNTFGGLCGATLVSDTNGSAIIGIHLGGTEGTTHGVYGSLTQQQLNTAFADLRSMEGVILSGEAGKFETVVLKKQLLVDQPLHKKSAINYLPENSQVEYFGSCIGRSVTKSEVKVTPISEHIVDVCGVPNIYSGPKMNPDWYGWQTCLSNLAIPAHPYNHKLLAIAAIDYKEELLKLCKSSIWNKTRPLTTKENVCGKKMKKFLDAIKLNTSIGFPLTGPKRKYIIELEPCEEWPNNREFEKEIMDEIDRLEACYARGERGYAIAKACKKDEILAKEKCRIFYSNSLALTFLIRKYFLPILRILQMNPLKSECAVGINSHGPEWEEFYQHVTKFGLDRLIGGDYGKYDQKLPSQLIFAALRILIDCAKECDYSEEDLAIMEAMTGDIVFAYIAFNGDLIGLTEGTHISGNSLTVIINGICGSLNLRCYFYSQYIPETIETRMKFREYVSAMTYGDDNIGSVSDKVDKFTIKGCSEFLKDYGQIYTMPDKESALTDFLPAEEFEFLKRKSVYHSKLGVHVGALLDKSIYKSLHCFMRGKNCVNTEDSACAQNIDGALREWFNHGEDKYEEQRIKMLDVARRAGISHLCTELDVTYNERVVNWRDQYLEPKTSES